MPHTLTLLTFAEKSPKHGQDIFMFRTSNFYSTVEPFFTTAWYGWVEMDGDNPTGGEIVYDPDDPTVPENCVLTIGLDGTGYLPTDLWCPSSDVADLVDEAEGVAGGNLCNWPLPVVE